MLKNFKTNFIMFFFHKFIAAVTTVNVIALSASEPEETIQFIVDRPFLAVITCRDDRIRIPLFICKIVNPQQSSRGF